MTKRWFELSYVLFLWAFELGTLRPVTCRESSLMPSMSICTAACAYLSAEASDFTGCFSDTDKPWGQLNDGQNTTCQVAKGTLAVGWISFAVRFFILSRCDLHSLVSVWTDFVSTSLLACRRGDQRPE